MSRRATLREVAAAAGVSVGTVSNVVTGRRPVRPETRAMVEAAVAKLGYRPDPAARALFARRERRPLPTDPARPRLGCIGYLCADHRAEVDVLPHRDDRAVAASIDQRLGGRAANVAVTAAGLGPPLDVAVDMLAVIGEDGDSDWAADLLTSRRVALHPASRVRGARLSRCIILVEPNGHRTILNEPLQVAPGAVGVWLADRRNAPGPVGALYVQADQLLGMAPVLPDLRASSLRLATHLVSRDVERLGVAGSLNVATGFDLVVVDRGAARLLTGRSGGDGDLGRRLAQKLAVLPGTIALTLGADGAMLISAGEVVAQSRAPALVPIDTTGAGDTFTGCLLAAQLTGLAAPTALAFAVAGASRSVLSKGAQDHGLTAAEFTI
ncbi:MAG: PfkB family carbohydrate kinase [Pseudomonadota bacterium]